MIKTNSFFLDIFNNIDIIVINRIFNEIRLVTFKLQGILSVKYTFSEL